MKIIDHGIFILEINGGVATMNFNTNNSKYPQELINSSFDRERRNLLKIIAYEWAPEITEINPSKKCISFKWYDNTCEDMIP